MSEWKLITFAFVVETRRLLLSGLNVSLVFFLDLVEIVYYVKSRLHSPLDQVKQAKEGERLEPNVSQIDTLYDEAVVLWRFNLHLFFKFAEVYADLMLASDVLLSWEEVIEVIVEVKVFGIYFDVETSIMYFW